MPFKSKKSYKSRNVDPIDLPGSSNVEKLQTALQLVIQPRSRPLDDRRPSDKDGDMESGQSLGFLSHFSLNNGFFLRDLAGSLKPTPMCMDF